MYIYIKSKNDNNITNGTGSSADAECISTP